MDYAAVYKRLMHRACGRCLADYTETHHVLPRCMGGSDEPENLVELTPEEHYVAHQLLVKMYPGNRALAFAAMFMAKQCTGNKPYGWLRRRAASAALGRKMPPRSAEHRAKISALKKGKKRGPRTTEWSAKIIAANTGSRRSAETRAKQSSAARGKPKSPEHLAKIDAILKARAQSPEWREKMAAAHRGKKHSPEHRAAVAAAVLEIWRRRREQATP